MTIKNADRTVASVGSNSSGRLAFPAIAFVMMLLLSAGLNLRVVAQDDATTNEVANGVSEKSIDELIEQLNAASSKERQQATRALRNKGLLAVEALQARLLAASGVEKEDQEKQLRQLGALVRIATTDDKELEKSVEKALLAISKRGRARLKRLASRSLSDVSAASEEQTIELLRDNNVKIKLQRGSASQRIPQEYQIEIGLAYSGTLDDLDALALLIEDASVKMVGQKYGDEYAQKLSIMTSLRGLTLANTSVTNDGLKYFEGVEALREIVILRSVIDEKVVQRLVDLPDLKRLRLIETNVTNEQVLALRLKYPKMRIAWSGGAFLGVNFQLSDEQCELTNIVPGSAAENGGMQVGDMLVKFDEQAINSTKDFQNTINVLKPEEEINATVTRNGQQIELKLTLGRRPYR